MATTKAPRDAHLARDLRGASRLATDAVAGLTGLVEAMHAQIARRPGRAVEPAGRTSGLTGLIYGAVRGTTQVVAGGLDRLFGQLEPMFAARPSSPGREAVLAALNGVLGDGLEASDNPLAITMSLRRDGVSLVLTRDALAAALPQASARVLVLVHGLCMNDLQWARDGADYASALARDLGATPVHLHYNTGRPVAANGRDFALLMQTLADAWPTPLDSIDLLTHSMGGLVARSALHQAAASGQHWRQRVRKVVFLGTPHHGAPLERGGQRLDLLLSLSGYTAPFKRLGRLRSAGITDLRHGEVLGSAEDRFAHAKDRRTPVPLPPRIEAFALAGLAAEREDGVKARLLGDGLVPLASALGEHRDPAFDLAFDDVHRWVARDTNHLQLQTSPLVYERVRGWLAGDLTAA